MGSKQPGETEQSYWRRDPPPDLAAFVTGFHGYQERGVPMSGVIEAASLTVPLIINFGSPFRIALGTLPTVADNYLSFAAGLYAGPVMMDSDGSAQCIQINFTPLGGRRFFGLPMHHLANRMAGLDDLADDGISELRDRLSSLNSWEARLELAETFVRARLQRSVGLDPAMVWAFDQIAHKRGNLRTGSLAARLGWSRRRLAETFRTEFGLTPKLIARIARFNAAQEAASTSVQPDWADIAAACGYADQAHMTREFSELAGSSPANWLRAA